MQIKVAGPNEDGPPRMTDQSRATTGYTVLSLCQKNLLLDLRIGVKASSRVKMLPRWYFYKWPRRNARSLSLIHQWLHPLRRRRYLPQPECMRSARRATQLYAESMSNQCIPKRRKFGRHSRRMPCQCHDKYAAARGVSQRRKGIRE